MKKFLKYLLVVLMCTFTAAAFTSCDKDDDVSPIVGTWVASYGSETYRVTFNKDGSMIESYTDSYYPEDNYTDYGTYTYNNGILTVTYSYEPGKPYTTQVTISGNNLIYEGVTFTRQ